ncbi:hybrid sensor histidine kinase/response regulator transcription factor [Plebeiibacterium marinum]|uniref:histidine kinase n=1 Tax=Plebeiibacterium marinum TaxID=2992111 RepID=A0AAE3MD36_9BACT|nr:hybrid sensor histidine kinase/response regulator transcription factor [Plebeiobacterium marinum]MCW3805362.1 response regulator [Plebeiobacterium marinum]
MSNYSFRTMFLIIWLSTVSIFLYASEIDYHAKELTIEDGLLSSLVNKIYQDKHGYIWIGTENGLSKYDGIHFNNYQYRPHDNNCLSSSIIYDIIQDADLNLYIGTVNGLNKIEADGGKIIFMPLIYNGQELEVVVNKLLIDDWNNLWIGTNKGLFIYNLNKGSFEDDLFNRDINFEVKDLCIDKYKNIWLTGREGVYKIAFEDSITTANVHNYSEINHSSYINCIKEITSGIWVSSTNANYFLPYQDDKVYEVSIVEKQSKEMLSDIKTVFADDKNLLWVGSGAGLYYFDDINQILRGNKQGEILLEVERYKDYCCIDDIFADRNNNIWVSSGKVGVKLLYQSSINSFKIYNDLFGDSLSKFYTSISVGNQKDLYAGSGGDGLYYFNNEMQTYSRLNFDIPAFKGVDIVITSTCMDASNNLWFGTYNKSLFSYDQENGLVDYSDIISVGNQNSTFPISAIVEYGDKLLVGSNGNGLYVYDKIKGKITNFNIENSNLSSNHITCLYIDKNNRIWIGTYWGLNLIDIRTERCRKFLYSEHNNASISNNIINSINEDQNGNLWICTRYGLNKFNEDFTFETIDNNYGLPSNYVCSIVEGYNQEVWIATKKGLCAMNLHDYSIKSYKQYDSKTIIEFDENVWNKDGEGNIYLGSNIGIIQFAPSAIKDFVQKYDIVMTDVKLLNKSIFNSNLIEKSLTKDKNSLKINHAQNVITFEYTALNFIDPEHDEFLYKLEGFDNEWQKVGNKRSATYTNLGSGNYEFKVKLAKQSDSKEVSIDVKILPPLWQKWYAYMLYTLILFLLLWIFKRYSIIKIKLKNELVTKEIKRQKDKEINEMKYRFFTNVSHEFRTPLTLIIGPLEKLKTENKSNPLYDIILKNANRMQRLVNQLLEFRMIESEVLKLNLRNGDIIKAIHEIYDVFSYLAEEKNIQFSIESTSGSYIMAFDYDKIEKILYNLISNAFKNTESGGKINVLVKHSSNNIQIIIEDSGVGISKEELPNIFDLFYSSATHKISKSKGGGVGLSLTKKLVDLQGGTIEVSSKLNEGTKFVVTLPQRVVLEQDEKDELEVSVSKSIENYLKEDFNDLGIQDTISGKESLNEFHGTVLIIEDNDEIRMFLNSLLSSKYQIIEASNGKEGLISVKKYKPNLVIADIMMPLMNGIDFCKRIKKDSSIDFIPVIIITAYDEKKFVMDALNSGAIDFIEKPFDPHILLTKVENIISGQQKLNEKFEKRNLVQPSIVTASTKDEDFLKKAIHFIEDNLIDDKISVELLAQKIGVTQISLYRKIKKYAGMTPIEFIKVIKVKKAAEFLKNDPGLTINEVSYMVGFNDIQYFRRCFKKEFGVNPSEYKRK